MTLAPDKESLLYQIYQIIITTHAEMLRLFSPGTTWINHSYK